MERNEAHILELLTAVKDPEIPVLNVVDMGVIRKVDINDDRIVVTITPTYSGCPAMDVISRNVKATLKRAFGEDAEVVSQLSPAWTTDWITDEAREKLREYGIAPPEGKSHDKSQLFAEPKVIACPKCGSKNTTLVSEFGSTSCKAHYKCSDCLEPFDYFKCI
ncbi:1,2-phenylacetyl-CoA epoxidase subunit PaaD [Sanyastnella coralliicola]|uniref:1,2-phenylacetyl-CoA epoxidase subunit PaaD n=1 Tax=Sanyastnella coralliicola TaxID=3069118 RepID=UPI0027B8FC6F|nr:1,2-phenylacetyl-CoA epoxidase subunit PaaD [Longitalea sp. SCSIO 12813]